ncbi:isochorismatase family protein [Gudongella sp. DL1XJH-153]|uniref:isochorismatase family protein n=1 Tax=Gudongella sp. DL1XJH-153 TaxID=3409804 RepID=UPI003BB71792
MKNYTLDRENTLLLMIDIQERLAPAIHNGDQIVDKNRILLTAMKELQMKVIHTEQYPKGLGKTLPELAELIAASPHEKVMFSAYNDEVRDNIFSSGKKNILVTGMETHVCVFQTVRDLLEGKYNVFVITDGVGSRTYENYRNALDMMQEMGAVITNTETVLFDLIKTAGTPDFKIVSKLVK